MDENLRKKIFERDNFRCQKCGFQDKNIEEVEVHHITSKVFVGQDDEKNLITLCSICHHYAPDNKEEFERYIGEKIDWNILETFRKSNRSISKKTKKGMQNQFNLGQHLSKAPKGYKLINKELVIDEVESKKVKEIFEEFVNTNVSLTQLGKKYELTTAGIKKLLRNKTYIGKVKFAEQESEGAHEKIISEDLFDKVQNKFNQ